MLNLKKNKTYNGLKNYHKIVISNRTYFGKTSDVKELINIVLVNKKKVFFISVGSRVIPKLIKLKSPDDIKIDNYSLQVFNNTQLNKSTINSNDLDINYDLEATNIYNRNFIDKVNERIYNGKEDFINTATSVIYMSELVDSTSKN
ncbi:hypothetical protein BFS06_13890 [Clostridium perfringens]|uniref:hypothetical protein n=1 Tax=Clostridium perfringens TaxID=1502 RepID=UPI00103ABAED|nr:hypothetical protein [Clostridium perfringens]TBX14297.1 hypothetical protein BFS06_13890 [Clostridium perfringens]